MSRKSPAGASVIFLARVHSLCGKGLSRRRAVPPPLLLVGGLMKGVAALLLVGRRSWPLRQRRRLVEAAARAGGRVLQRCRQRMQRLTI